MSENTTPNFNADSEEALPDDTTPELDTQPDEFELTPEQIRKALEPLFRDLNQVLYDYGFKDVKITAFTTASIVQQRAYSRMRMVEGNEEIQDFERELVAKSCNLTPKDCQDKGMQLCWDESGCYCSSNCSARQS